MNLQTQPQSSLSQAQSPAQSTNRKGYTRPTVKWYGSLADLTQSNGVPGTDSTPPGTKG